MKELGAMTDEQLIEEVATKVMEWHLGNIGMDAVCCALSSHLRRDDV